MKLKPIFIAVLLVFALVSCNVNKPITPPIVPNTPDTTVTPPVDVPADDTTGAGSTQTGGISESQEPTGEWTTNLAAVNCKDNGGLIRTRKLPDGTLYGVCYFDDARQCEAWAMLAGDCPVGGKKITGYENDAQGYCAISGGVVQVNRVPVMCQLPKEKGICSVDDFFANGSKCTLIDENSTPAA